MRRLDIPSARALLVAVLLAAVAVVPMLLMARYVSLDLVTTNDAQWVTILEIVAAFLHAFAPAMLISFASERGIDSLLATVVIGATALSALIDWV